MEFRNGPFRRWDRKFQRKLLRATLPGGWMKKFTQVNPDVETIVVCTGRELAGWTLYDKYPIGTLVHVFVNERYRRKGLGERLLTEVLRKEGKIVLSEWDNASRKLFRNFKKKFPKRVLVINHWKNVSKLRGWVSEKQQAR